MSEPSSAPAATASPAELPCLEDSAGRRHSFGTRDRLIVGRSKSADIPVSDPRCSRRQCELVRTEGGWLLAPLALDNPTCVNGRPVTDPVRLADGDRVELGDTFLV